MDHGPPLPAGAAHTPRDSPQAVDPRAHRSPLRHSFSEAEDTPRGRDRMARAVRDPRFALDPQVRALYEQLDSELQSTVHMESMIRARQAELRRFDDETASYMAAMQLRLSELHRLHEEENQRVSQLIEDFGTRLSTQRTVIAAAVQKCQASAATGPQN
jgi:hypothetical protein